MKQERGKSYNMVGQPMGPNEAQEGKDKNGVYDETGEESMEKEAGTRGMDCHHPAAADTPPVGREGGR